MLRQIIVRAISYPLQLLDSEGKCKFNIVGPFRIVSAFFGRYFVHMQEIRGYSYFGIKFQAFLQPILKKVLALLGPAKIFQLHLLEFAGPENKIARIDLVAEGLADLGNPERQLLSRDFQDVFELDKNGLGRFWT